MSKGYVNLHRKMHDWVWYSDINVRLLFIHLIMNANYKDHPFNGFIVPRGSIITGRKKLSISVGISEKKIRTAMDKLERSGCITRKRASKYSLVKITKYEDYQAQKLVKKKVRLKQKNTKITKKGQQRATIKEVINNNKLLYNNLTSVRIEDKKQSEKWSHSKSVISKSNSSEDVRLLFIYNFIEDHQQKGTNIEALASILKTDTNLAIDLARLYTLSRKSRHCANMGPLKDSEAWFQTSLAVLRQYKTNWSVDDMLKKIAIYVRYTLERKASKINKCSVKKEEKEVTAIDKKCQEQKYSRYKSLPEIERNRLHDLAKSYLIETYPYYRYSSNCRILIFTILEFMQKELVPV